MLLSYLKVLFKNCIALDWNVVVELLEDEGVQIQLAMQIEFSTPSLPVPCFEILLKNA